MAPKRVKRPDVVSGYDRWAASYDATPNPLVALDERIAPALLDPRPGERVLDAGCGTGRHLARIARVGARATGVDLSHGMLCAARRKLPAAELVRGDLDALPFAGASFDALLCALVGEHLHEPVHFFRSARAALRPGGRLLFTVWHPELARAGREANFELAGVEYRLGAEHHGADDYLDRLAAAGFEACRAVEFAGDAQLAQRLPQAQRYVGVPLLLALQANAA